MPNRDNSSAFFFSENPYKFGFNGKEKLDEISGNDGSDYDFGARIYDAKLGRWLSIDPHSKAGESPYVAFANNPIKFIDPNGEDTITAQSVNKVLANLQDYKELIDAFDVKITMSQSALAKAQQHISNAEASANAFLLTPLAKTPAGKIIAAINSAEITASKSKYGELVDATNMLIDDRNSVAQLYELGLLNAEATFNKTEAIAETRNQFGGMTLYMNKQGVIDNNQHAYDIVIDDRQFSYGSKVAAGNNATFKSIPLLAHVIDPYSVPDADLDRDKPSSGSRAPTGSLPDGPGGSRPPTSGPPCGSPSGPGGNPPSIPSQMPQPR